LFLVIPHVIVLFFLWIAFIVLSVVALFAILFTGRYPRGIFAARLSVAYPQSLSRGLVLVKWWLLALPHYVIIGVFTGGAFAGYDQARHGDAWLYGSGLIGLLVCLAGIALLFATLCKYELTVKHTRAQVRALRRRLTGEQDQQRPSTARSAAPALHAAPIGARPAGRPG
jgi:hypothetical protein